MFPRLTVKSWRVAFLAAMLRHRRGGMDVWLSVLLLVCMGGAPGQCGTAVDKAVLPAETDCDCTQPETTDGRHMPTLELEAEPSCWTMESVSVQLHAASMHHGLHRTLAHIVIFLHTLWQVVPAAPPSRQSPPAGEPLA